VRHKRRRWYAVAVLVVAGAAALWLALRGREPGPGPLANRTNDDYSFPVPARRPITWGVPVLYNQGDEPAVLLEVRPARSTPGMRVLKVLAAGENRGNYFIAGTREYPFRPDDRIRNLRPAEGFSVPPQTTRAGKYGVELVFVLQMDRPGRYEIDGIRARYRVGDTEHLEDFRFRLAACPGFGKAAFGGNGNDCKLPAPYRG
jgi:hypothetical protein